MHRRPLSIVGLTARLFRLKWHAASRGAQLAFMAALVVGGVVLATSAQCALKSSCGASGACPYSSGAAATQSPCSR